MGEKDSKPDNVAPGEEEARAPEDAHPPLEDLKETATDAVRLLRRGIEFVGRHPFATGLLALLSFAGLVLAVIGFGIDRQEADATTQQVEAVSSRIQALAFTDPEQDLSRLAMAHEPLTIADAQGFLDHYRFEPWLDRGSFRTFLLYAGGTDPSPGPRMILYFAGAGLCAVTHFRDLDLNSDARQSLAGYPTTFANWCYHDPDLPRELEATYIPILAAAD